METFVRNEARLLLHQLTQFEHASQALIHLFTGFSQHDTIRCDILLQILHWQCIPASSRLSHVLDDIEFSNGALQLEMRSDMELTVLGKPALHFATSIYDEDLAILIWSGFIQFRIRHPEFDLTRQVFDNSADSLGFSALHYAVEARMNRFIRAVCSGLKQHTTELVASRIVTRDVTLPINTAQTIGKNIASGGCSLLHLAAKKGDLEMVKVLVAPPMCMDPKTLRDWDDNSPARMAAIYGHDAVAAYLENITGEAPLSILDVDNERMSREKKATKRFLTQLEPNKSMLEPFVCQKIWTIEETMLICKEVNRVAAKQGWCKERHTSYQTTDMPCHQVPTLSSWICSTLTDRMFPQITQRYKLSRTERLSFRDLFFVKYEARSGERSNLELHRDGSILSFNILLNSTDAFTGGGTYFDSTKRTVHITQGDSVVHSGKILHGGAPVLTGIRQILVGFLDIADRVY